MVGSIVLPRHGLILTDLSSWEKLGTFFVLPETEREFPDNMGLTALVLRWTALEPGQLHRSVFMIDKARSWRRCRRLGHASWPGNRRLDASSSEAVLYGYFSIKRVEETFKDQYPESSWPLDLGGRAQNALYYLLEDSDNPLWDDQRIPGKRETRDKILVRAFRKGYRAAVEELGEKIDA